MNIYGLNLTIANNCVIICNQKEGDIVDNRMNDAYVEYFPLDSFVKGITLNASVLEHLQDTNNSFSNYLTKISSFDDQYIIDYWIYLLYEELKYSQKIENMKFNKIDLLSSKVFFDTLSVSHKRIHGLHNFAVRGEYEPTFNYRKEEVNVSRYNQDGKEEIFWRGAKAKDIDKFMNDFIKIYKQKDISLLMSNPFLKSSLIHLLFIRIHPYIDGNGRTARLLHNAKFTESINNIYGTSLKISPLNLSESIYANKITYTKAIDDIFFDLKHDNNEAINYWFEIMLRMADEQIYASETKLDNIDRAELKMLADCSHDDDYKTNLTKVKGIRK